MKLRLAAVVAAGSLLFAACGDDGSPTPEEAAAVRSLVDADLSDDEAACLVNGLASLDISLGAIAAGRLTPQEDAEVLAVTLDCIEDLGTVPSFVAAFIAGAADEGVTITEEQARCAIDAAGDADTAAAIADCLGGPIESPSAGYGDDPALDLLWDSCESGNNQACDELYLTSPLGSAYEDYARTCGGRLPGSLGSRCFDEFG